LIRLDKNVKTEVAVLADVGIIDRFSFIEGKTHESWHNKFKELYEIELEAVTRN
jgi:acetolactate synthase-1/2/3 large subunit